MIVMVGTDHPLWLCDVCHGGLGAAVVVYTVAGVRGHLPVPQVCCGGACAAIAEGRLAPPARGVEWSMFLKALIGA